MSSLLIFSTRRKGSGLQANWGVVCLPIGPRPPSLPPPHVAMDEFALAEIVSQWKLTLKNKDEYKNRKNIEKRQLVKRLNIDNEHIEKLKHLENGKMVIFL